MIARISSRWMRPPATCSEKPSNQNTNRTTTTVQIKLAMKNLPNMMSCYLIATISDYGKGVVGVNLGYRDPDPGLLLALSIRARWGGRSRVWAGIEIGSGSATGACGRVASAAEGCA